MGLGTHGDVEFFHDLSASGDLIALALLVELADFETFADSVRLQWMGGFGAQGSGARNLHWQRFQEGQNLECKQAYHEIQSQAPQELLENSSDSV